MFAPAAGSPPKLLNLRQSFLTKIHTRTRQQAKMFVVPEPQTSAVESLKQRGIIRFDTAWQMPILSVGCAVCQLVAMIDLLDGVIQNHACTMPCIHVHECCKDFLKNSRAGLTAPNPNPTELT